MPRPPQKYNLPIITTEPISTCVEDGVDATFSLVASGPPGLTYQWQILSGGVWTNLTNTGVYSGVTTDTMLISPASTGMDGSEYRCVVEWNINRYNISVVVTLQVGGCAGACACALLIPEFGGLYGSYAAAATAIADHVADCVGFSVNNNPDPGFPFSVDTSSPTAVVLNGSAKDLSGSTYFGPIVSMTMLAGNVGVTWTMTTVAGTGAQTVIARLYDCNWVQIGSQIVDTSGSFSITIPSDGTYYIFFLATLDTGSALTIRAAITLTPSTAFVLNPVIALWDDSGTTRQLEACPKMLLPTLTEDTGTWYSSCADAATVLSDSEQVSNCVGFNEGVITGSTFTATGGSSLVFSLSTGGAPSLAFGPFWGSINAVGGDTITATSTGGPGRVSCQIYDYEGVLVEDSGNAASPWASSALPYTGRYIVRVAAIATFLDPPFTSGGATITGSGTISTNEIQALYDVGLDCSGRLNCGDSCP